MYKHLFLCSQISVVSTPHQENFSLQQKETTTGNYNQSNCRFVELFLTDTSIKNNPKCLSQEAFQKGAWKVCKNLRIREFTMRLCTLVISEATTIKSYHCGCPNVTSTRIIMTMLQETRKACKISTLYKLL